MKSSRWKEIEETIDCTMRDDVVRSRYHDKMIGKLEELDWSDEEDPSFNRYMPFAKKSPAPETNKPHNDFDDDMSQASKPVYSIDEATICNPNQLFDHKRSYFSGIIKARDVLNCDVEKPVKIKNDVVQKEEIIPTVPTDLSFFFQATFINFLWKECDQWEDSFTGMLTIQTALKLLQSIERLYSTTVLFKPILLTYLQENYELDDYIDFVEFLLEMKKSIVTENVSIVRNFVEEQKFKKPNKNNPFHCCSHKSCQQCILALPVTPSKSKTAQETVEGNDNEVAGTASEKASNTGTDTSEDNTIFGNSTFQFRTEIIYNRLKHSLYGKIRIKHVLLIMKELNIPFDKKRLTVEQWDVKKELLIDSMDQLKELILNLQEAVKVEIDPSEHLYKYSLPLWLKSEFKTSEILLYQHQFTLIDIDGGGSIDVDELQELFNSMGLRITIEEAQGIIDEYDMDGGGTIDFIEFMVLIYKIQRGTIDLAGNDFAQILMEAKSQLKIFEEIAEVSLHPPTNCSIHHYGGSPIVCEMHIEGAADTVYAGKTITLECILFNGYPYRQPEVMVTSRIVAPNILTLLDGKGKFFHLTELWNAEWNINHLLEHIVSLLRTPDFSLLPMKFLTIVDDWEEGLRRKGLIASMTTPATATAVEEEETPSCRSSIPDRILSLTGLTMEQITSKANIQKIMKQFTKLEQMHIQILFLYLINRAQYDDFVLHVMK